MDRSRLNYFIDLGMAISFIAVFITGIIKFPEFSRFFFVRNRILHMYQITLIHDYSGLIFGILVIVHFVLHWKWIVTMTKGSFKKGGKK